MTGSQCSQSLLGFWRIPIKANQQAAITVGSNGEDRKILLVDDSSCHRDWLMELAYS